MARCETCGKPHKGRYQDAGCFFQRLFPTIDGRGWWALVDLAVDYHEHPARYD